MVNQNRSNGHPVLGGWLPASSTYTDPEIVIGYCLEKISIGFQALRKMTAWERELKRTTGKHRMIDLRNGATLSSSEREQKKRALDALKQAIKKFQQEEDLRELRKLAENLDQLRTLPFAEKGLLFLLFLKRSEVKDQNLALNILASATNTSEFNQLLEFGGGRKPLEEMWQPEMFGRFLALLERFEVDPWSPPFQKNIFTAPSQSEPKAPKPAPPASTLIHKQYVSAFLKGEINAAAMFGLSRTELYTIAERAYNMFDAGKLDVALHVFDALVYLEPKDSYFYTALGAVRQQQNDPCGSMFCYQSAIQLQPQNVSSLANRGEILFGQGKLTEALVDFQKVIQLDPAATNRSTLRVKILLTQLNEALDQKEKTINTVSLR